MTEAAPEETTEDHPGVWVAAWGDAVQAGDLLRVKALGGPVRVKTLRKFYQHKGDPRSHLVSPEDDGRWLYGAIVEDRMGQEFHLFIQPNEAVFIAVEVDGGPTQ